MAKSTNTNMNVNAANAQSSTTYVAALAGKQDEVLAAVISAFKQKVDEHDLFNGRWLDLQAGARQAGYEAIIDLLKEAWFKADVRSRLSNVACVVTRKAKDGSINNQIVYNLCKFKLVADPTKLAEYDAKTLKGSLVGYRFAADEQFVDTTDFAALHVEHEYTAPVMVEVTLPNGTHVKVQDAVTTTDEEGNVKVTKVTETLVGEFYPELDEHVSPKAFMNAVEASLRENWLKIFPTKSEEKAEQAAA